MFRVSKIPVYVSDTSIVRGGDVVYFVLLVSSANKNMVGGVKSRLHKRLSIVVSKLWNHRHRNIEQSNWHSHYYGGKTSLHIRHTYPLKAA